MWPRILLLLVTGPVLHASEIDDESLYGKINKGRLSQVSAVEGQVAELPCDVTTERGEADLRLVLWYDASGRTIYTYDARGQQSSAGSHWVSGRRAGSRLQLVPRRRPALLRVSAVSRADAGLYRCRVDFEHAPTRNSRVNLTVVVPPRAPVIFDELGRETVDGRIGPYRQGQTVNITCAAFHGQPLPNVTWWRDGTRLGDGWVPALDGSVRSRLSLGPLTRSDLGSRITCSAAFHPSSPPKASSTSIDMILAPLRAFLVGDNTPLSAGKRAKVTCRVTGSRPEPEVTWWLNGQRLPPATLDTGIHGNVSESRVTFTPQVKDNGMVLKCRAFNPELRQQVVEDSRKIVVYYTPIVTLTSWPRENISVGDVVCMRCSIIANPPVTQISWQYNDAPISKATIGMTINNDSLHIRRVDPTKSGIYTCSATNVEGTISSNAISLQIHFPPLCRSDLRIPVEATQGVPVNITCPVSAYPPPTKYRWSVSRNGELISVNQSRREAMSGAVSFTPARQEGAVSLLCWARNTAGQQTEPCRFIVASAEAPEAPSGCEITNRTLESLHVSCIPSYDGGRRQTFRLEVFRTDSMNRQGNATSIRPRFELRGLSPGQRYTLHVYAVNTRGLSPPASLVAHTLPAAAQSGTHARGSSTDLLPSSPLLGVLLGGVGVLLVITAVVVTTRRWQNRQPDKTNRANNSAVDPNERSNPDLIPSPQTGRIQSSPLPSSLLVEANGAPGRGKHVWFAPPMEMFGDLPPEALVCTLPRVAQSTGNKNTELRKAHFQ